MNTQLIVFDQVTFDSNLKQHTGGNVINRIRIKALPCVIQLSILLKIIDIPKNGEVFSEIKIVDIHNNLLSYSSYVHRNYRQKPEIPGVDQNLTLSPLIEETGTIFIECYLDGIKVNWYPIEIISC